MWVRLSTVVNGNVEFGDPRVAQLPATSPGYQANGGGNMFGAWFTLPSASSMTLQHNFGKKAIGFLVLNKSAACDVWQAATQPAPPLDKQQIILQASASGVNLEIFVI
jgi:hypothetical protein